MIKHYFKIALRNLKKHKIQNVIGILGLTIGLSFSAIGYNWLKYETSYDGFYPDSEQIFVAYGINKQSGEKLERLPFILGQKLKNEFPEVKDVTMIYPQFGGTMEYGEKRLGDPNIIFVDEFFLKLFPPKIIAGKTDDLLNIQDELVITESFARKHWNNPADAIGEVLTDPYRKPIRIVAVIENSPANSNFQVEGFRPDVYVRESADQVSPENLWIHMDEQIFIHFNSKADITAFNKKLENYAIDNNYNANLILKTCRITDLRHTLGREGSFNVTYIYTFAGAGFLLLFCAVFNFMNLYINRLLKRKREIKLRKALGSENKRLLTQFQIDLFLQLFLSFVIGVIILVSINPYFSQWLETPIILFDLLCQYTVISIIGIVTILAICVLVEYRYIRSLIISQLYERSSSRLFKNGSICLQLIISVFFFASATFMFQQVSFMKNFDWGFNPKGLIAIKMDYSKRADIVGAIRQHPSIQDLITTGIFTIRSTPDVETEGCNWEGKADDFKPGIEIIEVASNFFTSFGVNVINGRSFEESDWITTSEYWGNRKSTNKILINEKMASLIGSENIIGKEILLPTDGRYEDGTVSTKSFEIIGIVKDFHTSDLRNPTHPLIMKGYHSDWGYMNYAKAKEGAEANAIKAIRDIHDSFRSPGDPEDYPVTTLQQTLDDMRKSEDAGLRLFTVLTILCICIVTFGIYSISSSDLEQRRKEIAIRKVSGATTGEILLQFFREYVILFIISYAVTVPFTYYFIRNWLTQYVYKIEIDPIVFLSVFTFTLIVVLLTVFSQVWRAANQDPAKVLKSE